MVGNVNCRIIQLLPCPSPGEVPSREEVNCFWSSIWGEKTDKWEGIIELPIVEWIMDYGVPPKEKRKEVREEGGNGGKGCVERRMLCDAAAGWFWPSKEEGGLLSCLARETTPDLPARSSLLQVQTLTAGNTDTQCKPFFFSHSARTYRGSCVWSSSRLRPICSIFAHSDLLGSKLQTWLLGWWCVWGNTEAHFL